MALKTSLNEIPYKERSISITIQEYEPDGNGRPHEEDLTDNGWHADSIADIPVSGDYIGLWVDRMVEGTIKDPKFKKEGHSFKVLTRLFSVIEGNHVHCNLVVQQVTDQKELGRLIKE